MRRIVQSTVIASLLLGAGYAVAQDSAVIDGLPAGVMIYDADSAPAASVEPLLDVQAVPMVTIEPVSTEAVVDAVPIVTTPFTQSPASTRSAAQPLIVEGSPSGAVVLDPATITPQIDLAPGETVLQVIAAPSIVRVPGPEPAYTIRSAPEPVALPIQRAAPEPKVDPVSGRLRDTVGWTGRSEGPASIGCFPAGACAVLNVR